MRAAAGYLKDDRVQAGIGVRVQDGLPDRAAPAVAGVGDGEGRGPAVWQQNDKGKKHNATGKQLPAGLPIAERSLKRPRRGGDGLVPGVIP